MQATAKQAVVVVLCLFWLTAHGARPRATVDKVITFAAAHFLLISAGQQLGHALIECFTHLAGGRVPLRC
jgi:hypothetical protein